MVTAAERGARARRRRPRHRRPAREGHRGTRGQYHTKQHYTGIEDRKDLAAALFSLLQI